MFSPHRQDQRKCHKLGLAWFGRGSNAKLGEIVDVEIDAVKAITDVKCQELDRTKGWGRQG